jgi:hypothetical protein
MARAATPLRLRTLAALAAASALLQTAPALGQLTTPATALGVPAQPAVPGVEVGNAAAAARELSERLNSTAPGTLVTPRPGRVLLGSGTEEAPTQRTRGFMQPAFAPVPTAPVAPQGGQPSFGAGYATPGFFTMRRQDGPPAVSNLYTSPSPGASPDSAP